MALTRWDPFAEVGRLMNGMDLLFPNSFRSFRGEGVSNFMPVDIYEAPDELVVKASLPGFDPNDVHVNVERGMLTIQARRTGDVEQEEDKDRRWHFRELQYGEISRTTSLPEMFDADRAEASFTDGVLTLRLPKTEQAKPRQITINAG